MEVGTASSPTASSPARSTLTSSCSRSAQPFHGPAPMRAGSPAATTRHAGGLELPDLLLAPDPAMAGDDDGCEVDQPIELVGPPGRVALPAQGRRPEAAHRAHEQDLCAGHHRHHVLGHLPARGQEGHGGGELDVTGHDVTHRAGHDVVEQVGPGGVEGTPALDVRGRSRCTLA